MSRRTLLLLVGGAVAVRLLYALLVLPGYEPTTDALHYHELATAVSEGRGLVHDFPGGIVHPTAFRPPLWPLLLGAVYAVTGPSVGVAQVVTALLGGVAVAGLALLGARLAGPAVGLTAGAVAALHPVLVSGDGPPLSEPLGSVLLVGLLLAVADRRVVLAGLLGGAFLLTRPSAQVAFLVLALVLPLTWGWRRTVAWAALVVAVATPWLVRNAVQLGEPVLTSSTGFNLAATYSREALAEGHFVDPVYDDAFAAVRARARAAVPAGAPPGALEVVQDAAFRDVGLAGLRADPAAPLQVARNNVARLLALPGEPAAEEADLRDGRSESVRPFVHVPGLALLAAGAVGLVVLARRRWREAAPLLLVAASVPVASLLTVAAPRLRQPTDLLACVGVGVLLVAAGRAWRARAAARAGAAPPYGDDDLALPDPPRSPARR